MRFLLALMLISGGLAGCVGPEPALEATIDPTANLASYLHNLTEENPAWTIVDGILEQHRIPIDGELNLDGWIVRPPTDEPVPLILEITPYYGGGSPIIGEGPIQHWFGRWGDEMVARGFAVGIVSVRGTGNSDGCFTMGGPSEARDSAAAIEYLAAQSWSNGKVGLMGVSYPGTTPQDVWVEAPPSLKTIVPISGISDLYKYNFVNGVPIAFQGYGFNTYYWAMVGASPAGLSGGAQPADPASVPGAVAGEACEEQIEVQEGGISSAVDGNKDEYWQLRDFHAELLADWERNDERASVLYVHGLQDWNVKPHNMEDWLDAVQASGVPFKALLGQWGHAWPESSFQACEGEGSACRSDWWESLMPAWFDYFLKGIDNGIMDAPAVQVQDDTGVWRNEDAWPSATGALVLHPDGDGTLGDAPGTGSVTYFDNRGEFIRPPQFLEDLGGVTEAVFVSEPVERNLHLSGMPRFTGNVSADGERSNLILTLGWEKNGAFHAVNFAALSLNHAQDLNSGNPDISNQVQTVEVDFFPQEDIIPAGSRIVLIAAGNIRGAPGPGLAPVTEGTFVTIDLAGARLDLPVDATVRAEAPQPYESL